MKNSIILGGGISGICGGYRNNIEIYEKQDFPGGICASYYVTLDGKKSKNRENEETYRFELGGGHWIFGASKEILEFIDSLSKVKTYYRKSAVYFPDLDLYVPYPIQNHLFYLPDEIKNKAVKEIFSYDEKKVNTLQEWLEVNFGPTLCELFFYPFHDLYTAGLYTTIAPQDTYKSPVDKKLIQQGLDAPPPPVGYNVSFVYPKKGLDDLIRKMAKKCKVNYEKEVVKIDINKKEVFFKDGSGTKYEKIVSTLPLNKVLEMCGIDIDKPGGVHTSVLVVNIGARKGIKCPNEHWIYIPKSNSGFHRVGFYSNVDVSFLPLFSRKYNDRVSIYVEKAYRSLQKPSEEEIKKLCNNIVKELQGWKFIEEPEVVDPTWIDVAYTWEYPNSNWKQKAIETLRNHNIYQIGRYGKWHFQGIAESVKDGLEINLDFSK